MGISLDFYAGCTALVTGASSGLGAEFARQLAPVARYLILVARRTDRLDELKSELEARHPTLHVVTRATDLSNSAEIEALGRWMKEEDYEIDLLVNNAGLGDYGCFESAEWSKIDLMIRVNVQALSQLTLSVLPGMIERKTGAILNVSSIAAFFPVPKLAVYAATKAYVNSFSEALRAELRGTGVGVTAVCPGPVDTEFRNVADREPSDRMPAPDASKTTPQEVVSAALSAAAADRPRVIPNLLLAIAVLTIAAIPLLLKRPFLNQYVSR